MASANSSFSPLEEEDRSSSSTLLGDDEEKDETEYEYNPKLPHKFSKTFNKTYQFLIAFLVLLPWALLPFIYKIGEYQGAKVLPKLPTHGITDSAVKYQLKILDDEFYTTEPENLKYKGVPRKELDDAWNALIENLNIRVHPAEAKAAGWESVELADGSGDMFALPAVFHNLHCLYAIRRAMFPNVYIDDKDAIPPGPNQINIHTDHCIDTIRQALMCHGDMSLYYFYWPTSEGRSTHAYPRHVGHKEHMCVDWDNLQSEAHKRHFSISGKKKLLVNPIYPDASLKHVDPSWRMNYSVYDGMNIKGPQLYEGLEDLEELKRLKNLPASGGVQK
ncbi:hypothetical protein WAI453_002468 [Rhynchosporium graminicola]|uniref:Uncharacterized protein n=1 Tax=Rhynchosporium graminicola TaxID=2792576 RepID=A0A1E1KNF9_9HELO|nr:uncharacterized protein RCO7_07890 [Rhynchosporium commune]